MFKCGAVSRCGCQWCDWSPRIRVFTTTDGLQVGCWCRRERFEHLDATLAIELGRFRHMCNERSSQVGRNGGTTQRLSGGIGLAACFSDRHGVPVEVHNDVLSRRGIDGHPAALRSAGK